MHTSNTTPLSGNPAHDSIYNRAFNLVALSYMLRNFQPHNFGGVSEQDMIINLQLYGLLLFNQSQGLFADIERIIEPPTTNTKGENYESANR